MAGQSLSYQHSVLRQIICGLVVLALVIWAGLSLLPAFPESARHAVLAASLLLSSIPLFLSIAAVMLMRYADAGLISGYRAEKPVGFAQAFLQNTQEQTVVHALTLTALALSVPADFLQLPLLQACCFLLGRALYWQAYRQQPLRRFTGFALGWYAAVASFLCSSVFLLQQLT